MAAEAAEMLVRAARPTASSTFSGYRYVSAGDLGSVGRVRGRLDRRESGRRTSGERERENGRGSIGSEARENHQGALQPRNAHLKSAEAAVSSPQLPLALAATGPRGARLCTRARLSWYLQARAAVHLAWYMCVHCLSTYADSEWPWAPLRRTAVVRRSARVPVSVCSPLPRVPET